MKFPTPQRTRTTEYLLIALCLASTVTTPAIAASLGEMAEKATESMTAVSPLVAAIFYVVGAILAGAGLLRLKKHMDHPQQASLGSGFATLIVGACIIAAPAIINGLLESADVRSGGTVNRFTLPSSSPTPP